MVDVQAPATGGSLDDDIAAMAGEDNDAPEVDAEGNVIATGDEPEPDNTDDTDNSTDEPEEDVPAEDNAEDEDDITPVKGKKVKLDVKKLEAAIEANDPKAFIEALGPAADSVLSGKAHKVLRLQVKEVLEAQKTAQKDQATANELTDKLLAKYSDPIEARKSAEKGNVDGFIDMVEKWGGMSWNDLMKWVNKGIAGRPERLAAKSAEQVREQTEATTRQTAALEETKTWVKGSLEKTEAKLLKECPELIDLCIAELKENFSKGINTPAKAVVEVKRKLKGQYEALSRLFGPVRAKPVRPESPSTRSNRSDAGQFRELSVEELIAETIKESRGKK